MIKVRMGIHSGNTEWSGTDYMGYITLARANRVMSSAYGGQILMSDDSYRMTEGYINESISIRIWEKKIKRSDTAGEIISDCFKICSVRFSSS
ncbi:MAG: hypothetical protein IPH77_16680 [Ignavibacteria bacterium]|nr:hypothetical protein [Ignavibacteria bacterium]